MRYSERDLSRARLYSVCDVISDSQSCTEEVIHTSQEAEIKNMSADLVIKDIMGRDNDKRKRLSSLRIPTMVSCCWLHQDVN